MNITMHAALSTAGFLAILALLPAWLQRGGHRAATLMTFLLLTGIAALATTAHVLLSPAAGGAGYLLFFATATALSIQGTRRRLLRRRAHASGWQPRKEHRTN